eukprot:gnl/TRDRNA2_/TRDRNA2_193241_c0_seq1.p1 gnl/TRDRNA2_/TRDRNA2_193241_c0~~gnl/TRDRNA2_/TRDRNA2_193241_c0_seq1.p1  ORF type:complete len:158 (-),score=29.31 gnl/TRDRNA2_/TRDRNA2_193241_c0_seq1:28-501(-)
MPQIASDAAAGKQKPRKKERWRPLYEQVQFTSPPSVLHELPALWRSTKKAPKPSHGCVRTDADVASGSKLPKRRVEARRPMPTLTKRERRLASRKVVTSHRYHEWTYARDRTRRMDNAAFAEWAREESTLRTQERRELSRILQELSAEQPEPRPAET